MRPTESDHEHIQHSASITGHRGTSARPRLARGRAPVRRWTLSAAAAVGMIAVGATPAHAMVNGWTPNDPGQYASIAEVNTGELRGTVNGQPDQLISNAVSCTGTLVHPGWVLTARHCVDPANPGRTTVRIGNRDLGAGGVQRKVIAIRAPDIDGLGFRPNDIALLALDSRTAQPTLSLADPADRQWWTPGPTDTLWATAIGWGNTDPAGSTTPSVLQATVIVQPAIPAKPRQIPVAKGTGTPCQGDSGSPLLVKHGDGYGIAGVLAGSDCATGADYVMVGEGPHHDWIRATIPDIDNPYATTRSGGADGSPAPCQPADPALRCQHQRGDLPDLSTDPPF